MGLIVEVSVFGLACHDLDYFLGLLFFGGGGVTLKKGEKIRKSPQWG